MENGIYLECGRLVRLGVDDDRALVSQVRQLELEGHLLLVEAHARDLQVLAHEGERCVVAGQGHVGLFQPEQTRSTTNKQQKTKKIDMEPIDRLLEASLLDLHPLELLGTDRDRT